MTSSPYRWMAPLRQLIEQLATGAISSRELIESCLERIADTSGQGGTAFLKVHAERARAEADAVDRRRRAGIAQPQLAGIPVSIKDLFDVFGDVTAAGSRVLLDRLPATADAPAVARLREAGCIVIGRTNMTEFAYSGLGLNPHFGTPLNPFDRGTGRIPGGSSSGAAIAVTDGMAAAGLGTDTGGSCRIPAALTGIVGFKPTAHRVPRAGVIPLSFTLDSVGQLARTVDCCAQLDAILAGEADDSPAPGELRGARVWVPTTLVLDGLDAHVAATFDRALAVLARAGALISHAALRMLSRLPQLNRLGGISAAEAYAWHRELIEARADAYDPRVAVRILKGREQSAADYLQLMAERARMIAELDGLTTPFDVLAMPTVPVAAPTLAELADDERYVASNALMLRNASIANFFDRCAISVPIHRDGEAPVGLMLIGERDADRRLLAIAQAAECLLSPALPRRDQSSSTRGQMPQAQ